MAKWSHFSFVFVGGIDTNFGKTLETGWTLLFYPPRYLQDSRERVYGNGAGEVRRSIFTTRTRRHRTPGFLANFLTSFPGQFTCKTSGVNDEATPCGRVNSSARKPAAEGRRRRDGAASSRAIDRPSSTRAETLRSIVSGPDNRRIIVQIMTKMKTLNFIQIQVFVD